MRVEQLIGHDPDGDVRITLTYEQYKALKRVMLDATLHAGRSVGVTMSYNEYNEYNDMLIALEGYKHDEYR